MSADQDNIDEIIASLKNNRVFIEGIKSDVRSELINSVKGDSAFRSEIITAMEEKLQNIKNDLVGDFEAKYIRNLFSFIIRFAPWLLFTGIAIGIVPVIIFISDNIRVKSNEDVAKIIERNEATVLANSATKIVSSIESFKHEKAADLEIFKKIEETKLAILEEKISSFNKDIDIYKEKIDLIISETNVSKNEISNILDIAQNKVLSLQHNIDMTNLISALDRAKESIVAELAANIQENAEFKYMLWRYLTPDDYLLAVSQNAPCPDGFTVKGSIDIGLEQAMKSLMRSQARDTCMKKRSEMECDALMTNLFGKFGMEDLAVFDAGPKIKLCVKRDENDQSNVPG